MTQFSDERTPVITERQMTSNPVSSSSHLHSQSQHPRSLADATHLGHVTPHCWRHIKLFPRRRSSLVDDHPYSSWRHLVYTQDCLLIKGEPPGHLLFLRLWFWLNDLDKWPRFVLSEAVSYTRIPTMNFLRWGFECYRIAYIHCVPKKTCTFLLLQ